MKYTLGRSGVALVFTVTLAALFGALVWLSAAPASAADPVLVGAGDIASCTENGDEITANMLDGIAGTVFTAGDNAYENGTLAEYQNCYGPSWGRHKDRTRPVPGNHEYNSGGGGYYSYFGANAGPSGRGYYSYDLGSWHVVTLNSNVAADPASAQYRWLQEDLAASNNPCTMAMWHHPVFSSGEHGNNTKMAPMYKLLDESGADLALVGHDHDYERFAPQTYSGVADANGMTQIVVGTGGRHLRPFGSIKPNSLVRNSDTFGLFEMTLHAGSLDYRFVPQPGKTFADSGTMSCGATTPPPPDDTTPPETTITSGPSGTVTTNTASFAFSSSEAGSTFQCRLDGAAFAACTSPRSYAGLANGSHTFEVKATDAAGNADATPAGRTWTVDVPPAPPDTTPPETTITSGPSGTVTTTSASFGFSSSEANSTFQCRLDGAAFGGCTSPKSYTGLANGSHTFEVKATDAAGNADASPASRTWTVNVPPAASPTNLSVTDGWDPKAGKTLSQDGKVYVVTGSDNQWAEIEQGQFLSLRFAGGVPAGATITSAKLYVEHHEEDTFQSNALLWEVGGGDLRNPTVLAGRRPPILAGESREASVEWDVTSVLNTPARVNDAKFVIRNTGTNGKKAKVDRVYLVLTYG